MKKNLWKLMLAGTFTLSQLIVPQFTILSDTELFENKSNIVHAAVVDSGNCGTEGHESDATWTLDSSGVFTVSGTGPMNDYSSFSTCPWDSHREQIKKVIIDDGITTIGTDAFADCNNLYSVSIPDSVTYIGEMAFADCIILKSVVIPESVTMIDMGAFFLCSNLTSVTIQGNDINTSSYTFEGTPWIKEKQKENPLVIVGGTLILGETCSGDIIIPDNVTRIADDAFRESKIKSVVIPESVKNIGESAFSHCSYLESVIIPEGITCISEYAFSHCNSLSTVILPEGLTNIDGYAFIECTKLVSVNIPKNVTNIGTCAFSYCSRLTSVFLESTKPPKLCSDMFNDPSHKIKIYVPADKIDDYKNADGWNYYSNIILANTSAASSPDTEAKTYKKGDFDGDGKVDITDLSALSLYLIGDKEFTEAQINAADVTGDGNTDLADLAHLRQFLSKKTEKFDAE